MLSISPCLGLLNANTKWNSNFRVELRSTAARLTRKSRTLLFGLQFGSTCLSFHLFAQLAAVVRQSLETLPLPQEWWGPQEREALRFSNSGLEASSEHDRSFPLETSLDQRQKPTTPTMSVSTAILDQFLMALTHRYPFLHQAASEALSRDI